MPIKSSSNQAREIAKIANSPVLCMEKQLMVYPEMFEYSLHKIPSLPRSLHQRIIKPLCRRIERRIFDINSPAEENKYILRDCAYSTEDCYHA